MKTTNWTAGTIITLSNGVAATVMHVHRNHYVVRPWDNSGYQRVAR